MSKQIKLNLGCGKHYKGGYINDAPHAKVIIPERIGFFSNKNNNKRIKGGASISIFGMYLNVGL